MHILPTKRSFAEHLGASFRVRTPGLEQDLVLHEITRLEAELERPFSLLFRGPAGSALPQQIHVLDHPALASLELFLVPVAREGEHVIYEALFN